MSLQAGRTQGPHPTKPSIQEYSSLTRSPPHTDEREPGWEKTLTGYPKQLHDFWEKWIRLDIKSLTSQEGDLAMLGSRCGGIKIAPEEPNSIRASPAALAPNSVILDLNRGQRPHATRRLVSWPGLMKLIT